MGNNGLLNWIKYLSVAVLLLLTALSYHPRFANLVLESEMSNPLMKYIYLFLALAFILHIDMKGWFGDARLRKIFIYILLLIFTTFVTEGIFGKNRYFTETQNIVMATIFVLIGYSSKMQKGKLLLLIISYALVVDYSTIAQIFSNWGGFRIADQYMKYGKNTLGVMLAASCIAMAVCVTNTKSSILKVVLLSLILLTLFLDLTIRARASFLTISILLAYIFFKSYDKKNTNKIAITVIGLLAGVVIIPIFFPSFFFQMKDYIIDSFTQNQGDDLTSGRMSRNIYAVNFIFEHLFFGNLPYNESYKMIHNYVLRQLADFGIIGGFPLMLLYFNLLCIVIKHIYKNGMTIKSIGYVVMLVPFIISLEEPTFPYSPGTGSILSFFLFGHSIKLTSLNNYK